MIQLIGHAHPLLLLVTGSDNEHNEGIASSLLLILVRPSTSKGMSLTSTHSVLASSQETDFPLFDMDHAQPSHGLNTYVPNRHSASFERRQRLRAIVSRNRDLYDPPNTAAAFSLLEAALQESERSGPVSNTGDGQYQMLDPPTTAERFFQIESAIDKVRARSATTTGRPKRSKSEPQLSMCAAASDSHARAHLLRKRQQWRTEQDTSAKSHFSRDTQLEEPKSACLPRRPYVYVSRDTQWQPFKLSFSWGRTTGEDHIKVQSVTEPPIPGDGAARGSNQGPYDDVDIFQDDASVQSFVKETYDRARERYL